MTATTRIWPARFHAQIRAQKSPQSQNPWTEQNHYAASTPSPGSANPWRHAHRTESTAWQKTWRQGFGGWRHKFRCADNPIAPPWCTLFYPALPKNARSTPDHLCSNLPGTRKNTRRRTQNQSRKRGKNHARKRQKRPPERTKSPPQSLSPRPQNSLLELPHDRFRRHREPLAARVNDGILIRRKRREAIAERGP